MSEAVKSRPTIAHRRRLATAAPAIRCSRMLDAAPWTEGSGGKEATPYTCGLLPVTCYWMASSRKRGLVQAIRRRLRSECAAARVTETERGGWTATGRTPACCCSVRQEGGQKIRLRLV